MKPSGRRGEKKPRREKRLANDADVDDDSDDGGKQQRKQVQQQQSSTAMKTKKKRSREERRDSLETKQIDNSHFTDGKLKQNPKICRIPFTKRAKKTAEKH